MALRVVSCCTYLTEVASVVWRARDHDAHDFVKAVKGQPINGFAQIPCRGEAHRIDDSNRDLALELFGRMVADAAREHGLSTPGVVVPVPNSRCHVGCPWRPRTLEQAQVLALELERGVTVLDAFRWSESLLSASAGGGQREPQHLFDRLRIVQEFPAGGLPCILVDDVLTSGGHLQACAAALRARGHSVELALVAGRALRTQMAEPFAVRVEVLADFTPRRNGAQ
jgi:hypothetical protein